MKHHIRYMAALALGLWLAGCSGSPDEPIIDDTTTGFGPGYTCSQDSQCESGYCVMIYGLMQCAAMCQDATGCPSDLVCAYGDPRSVASAKICMPPNYDLCVPCVDDVDCGRHGHRCDSVDGQKVCLAACDGSCPVGYQCQETTALGSTMPAQCYPVAGTCSCGPSSNGEVRSCNNSNSAGTCFGTEQCLANTGWTACDAAVPAPEDDNGCDGVDNNCDGLTDIDSHGDPIYRACGFGYTGNPTLRPAECQGVEICVNGQYQDCWRSVMPPAEEVACDGLDEDCDGEADDDFFGSNDHCTACGDQCDPGGDMLSVFSWGCIDRYTGCAQWVCDWPYYDVDDDAINGCELEDDSKALGDQKYHTNIGANARQMHDIECSTEGTPCDPSTWDMDCGEVHYCGARLPRDLRPNYYSLTRPSMDDIEGNDFYYFYYRPSTFCSRDLKVRLHVDTEGQTYDTEIEVCVSEPVEPTGDPIVPGTWNPDYPITRCATLNLDNAEYDLEMVRDTTTSETKLFIPAGKFYFVWVEAKLQNGIGEAYDRFAGHYDLQLYEKYSDPIIDGGVGYISDDTSPCAQ